MNKPLFSTKEVEQIISNERKRCSTHIFNLLETLPLEATFEFTRVTGETFVLTFKEIKENIRDNNLSWMQHRNNEIVKIEKI